MGGEGGGAVRARNIKQQPQDIHTCRSLFPPSSTDHYHCHPLSHIYPSVLWFLQVETMKQKLDELIQFLKTQRKYSTKEV